MLPSMNESLESFKSQAPYSLGTVVHVSNCSTWNVKTERYEFKAILSYIWSWETNLRHVKACLKKNKEKKKERKGWVWLCFHYSFNYSTHETEAGQQLSLNRGQPHLHIELLASQGYKWHRLKFKKGKKNAGWQIWGISTSWHVQLSHKEVELGFKLKPEASLTGEFSVASFQIKPHFQKKVFSSHWHILFSSPIYPLLINCTQFTSQCGDLSSQPKTKLPSTTISSFKYRFQMTQR